MHPLGGFVGVAEYGGELGEFVRLIKGGEQVLAKPELRALFARPRDRVQAPSLRVPQSAKHPWSAPKEKPACEHNLSS